MHDPEMLRSGRQLRRIEPEGRAASPRSSSVWPWYWLGGYDGRKSSWGPAPRVHALGAGCRVPHAARLDSWALTTGGPHVQVFSVRVLGIQGSGPWCAGRLPRIRRSPRRGRSRSCTAGRTGPRLAMLPLFSGITYIFPACPVHTHKLRAQFPITLKVSCGNHAL